MAGIDILLAGALVLVLTPIVVVDVGERRIPDPWSLTLGVVGLVGQMWRAPQLATLGRCALAVVLTAGLFLGLVWLMRVLRREATLGAGDVKFMIAASLWVGFIGASAVFVIASLIAAGWALAASPWRRLDLRSPFAFAPALATALVGVFLVSTAR